MKINFDTIEKDLLNSFDSTLTSSAIFPSSNHFSFTNLSHHKEMTKSLISSNSFDQNHKNSRFSKNNQKNGLVLGAGSTNLFSDKDLTHKVPKKFKNIKTINEMQNFMKSMDRVPSSKQISHIQDSKNNQHSKSKQKIQQVTSRLYQTFKNNTQLTTFCKRKSCKQMISTIDRHSIEDLMNFTGQPNKDRNNTNTNLSKSAILQVSEKFYHSLDTSIDKLTFESTEDLIEVKEKNGVHERLFKDSRVRKQFKENTQKQAERKCIQLSKSLQKKREESQQNKNKSKSRSFYQRLSQLSQRHKNKDRLCQIMNSSTPQIYNKNLKTKKNQKNQANKTKAEIQKEIFQNAAILSQTLIKCSKVKCHNNEEQLRYQKQEITQQIPYISKKTKEIMQEQQKRLLTKLKGLFYDKSTKKIKINSAKVYLLSERQFSILFQLITNIQKKASKIKTENKLQQIIASFYQNLGFAEKQELRRSQVLSDKKVKDQKKLQQSLLNAEMSEIKQMKSRKSNANQNDKNLTDSSSVDPETDYCARLAMFV